MDPMTDFLTGYVDPAGADLAGAPGLKASRQSTGGASSDAERRRIGKRHGIRVVPG